MKKNNQVLFFTQTSESGASARYRVYQYIKFFEQNGLKCDVAPALSVKECERYATNASSKKIYLKIFINRLNDLIKVRKYDLIFFQRDFIIYLYPFFEQIISRLYKKDIIFDFDDTIYLYPPHKNKSFIYRFFADENKIEKIIRMSKYVVVGNSHLRKYAGQFKEDKNIFIIPTSINLELYNKPFQISKFEKKYITIGWVGSQMTSYYLSVFYDALEILSDKYKICLKVIGAKVEAVNKKIKVENVRWESETEIDNIRSFDIGIMPLTDDPWSQGKCGTKILQYMAANVPSVSSPVGINKDIVVDGENGFLASTTDEWVDKISVLIENNKIKEKICINGFKTVTEKYSVQANSKLLLDILNSALGN